MANAGLEHLLSETGDEVHDNVHHQVLAPHEIELLGGADFEAVSAAAAAAIAAGMSPAPMPLMSAKKKPRRKIGDPLSIAPFDGGPDEHEVQAALDVAGRDPRARSHVNSGADILLLLHDRYYNRLACHEGDFNFRCPLHLKAGPIATSAQSSPYGCIQVRYAL